MDDERPPAFASLDAAYEGGWSGLRRWYHEASPAARERHAMLRVHPPRPRRGADAIAPLALEVDGAIVAWLQARVARGNNSDVYLTQGGDVLKVARTPRFAKKLLLQAWTGPRLGAHGIRAAAVRALDRDGVYLVQERVPGPAARDAWRHESALGPAERACILLEITRLRALGAATDLWIDLRARDVILGRDGALVHVDYGPRVHMDGSTTYSWLDEAGARRFHDDEEAILRFLDRAPHHHQAMRSA